MNERRIAAIEGPGIGPVQRRQQHLEGILLLSILLVAVAIPITSNSYILGVHAMACLLLPSWLPTARNNAALRWLWGTGLIWVGGQFLSNLLNDGEFTAAIGALGFLIPLVVTLMVWLHDGARLSGPALTIAFAGGWLGLELLKDDGPWTTDNPWKFGLATPTAVLLFAIAWHAGASRRTLAFLSIGFAATSLIFDSRFNTLLGVILAATVLLRRPTRLRRRSWRKPVLLGGVVALLLYSAYPHLALSGFLGERAESQQRQYEALDANFLLANRAEAFQAAYIFVHHPLTGIGAKSKLQAGEADATLKWLSGMGVPMTPDKEAYLLDSADTSQGYATHSAALDTAVQGGILALPFWAVALLQVVRAMGRTDSQSPGRSSIVWLLCGLTLWNSMFSPLESTTALTLILALTLGASDHTRVGKGQPSAPREARNALPQTVSRRARHSDR